MVKTIVIAATKHMKTEIVRPTEKEINGYIDSILQDHWKLKKVVTDFTESLEKFYNEPGNESAKPTLKSIIESEKFADLKTNATKKHK